MKDSSDLYLEYSKVVSSVIFQLVKFWSAVLVELGVLRVGQVKDNTAVGTGTTTANGEDVLKVDGAVEAKRAILKDVNPVTLVVSGGVKHGDLLTC